MSESFAEKYCDAIAPLVESYFSATGELSKNDNKSRFSNLFKGQFLNTYEAAVEEIHGKHIASKMAYDFVRELGDKLKETIHWGPLNKNFGTPKALPFDERVTRFAKATALLMAYVQMCLLQSSDYISTYTKANFLEEVGFLGFSLSRSPKSPSDKINAEAVTQLAQFLEGKKQAATAHANSIERSQQRVLESIIEALLRSLN